MLLKKFKNTWQLCKELGPLGPLMLFAVVGPALGALVLISTSHIWLSYMQEMESGSLFIFLSSSILLVGLSFVPTHASSLISGMLYGLIAGPVYALLAVVAASYFAFLLMRWVMKDRAVDALLKRPNAAKIHEELLNKSGFKALLFISLVRLSPVMPFAGTNLLLAASQLKTNHFLYGTLIGMAPRVILVAVAGAGLSELDLSKSSNMWLAVVGGLSTLILIIVIGKIAKKVYSNQSTAS